MNMQISILACVAMAGFCSILGCSDPSQPTPVSQSPAPAADVDDVATRPNADAADEWFEAGNGESIDDLIALEGKYRTDSLIAALEQVLNKKADRVGVGKLTNEERTILAIAALEREVHNGGFAQFFANSSREYAPQIVNALGRIGCPKTAAITQDALTIVEKSPLTDDEIQNGTWAENQERQASLEKCDTLYFERPEKIEDSLFGFIKRNRGKIEP